MGGFKVPAVEGLVAFAIFGMLAAAVLLVGLIYWGVSFLASHLVWVW